MRFRLSTYDSGDLLFEGEHQVASAEEVIDLEGSFRHDVGEGHSRVIVLDGLVVIRGTHSVNRNIVLQSEQDVSTIDLHFRLDGGPSDRVTSDGEINRIRPGEHNILYSPDTRNTFAMDEGRSYEMFEVSLTPEYFRSLAERYPNLIDGYFSPVARGEPFRLHETALPIEPQMINVIRQILQPSVEGPLGKMLIEAKVIELLALQLRQFEERGTPFHSAAELSPRDVDRMVDARDRILARMDDPPSLRDLARQVGTNEFALKRDFKTVFGNTVYGLLLDHKMQRARTLLLDTRLRVSDVAEELGYSQTGHFSAAFKKKYGMSPSDFRGTN